MSGKADYRDASRIEHMYAALCRVMELSAGVSKADFVEGNSTAELILYHLIILGEAANNVSDEFCKQHGEIDGDTIEVQRDSENIIVRLIGIDAPESVNPNPELNTAEGEAASSYVLELLEDIDVVYLEYDFQIRDSYDRTLAYVWYYDDQDLRMLNLQLVEDDIAIPINGSINQRYRRCLNNASS